MKSFEYLSFLKHNKCRTANYNRLQDRNDSWQRLELLVLNQNVYSRLVNARKFHWGEKFRGSVVFQSRVYTRAII